MSNPMPSFSRNRERLILLVLAVVQFTSIVDFMVVMPLEPELEGDLHLTPTRFGLIVSSYTFAAGLAGLLASMFVDRFARRTAFLAIYAGFLVGTFACGMAPDYGWLLAARVLTGAFGGVLGGMAFAIVGDVFPEERRGRATGAIMSGFALASVLGVPVGLTLGQIYGWHTPFRLLAVLGVPIFFIAAKVLPPLNAHMIAGPRTQSPLAHLKETFIDPNNLRAFALTISMMFGVFCVVPFLAPYLVSNVGIAKDHLWVVYTTGGVLTLIGSPIIGKLADRHGKLLVYRVIAPVLCVVVLVATNLPPVHLVIATLVMGGMMLCNGGRMVPAMAMITSSVAPSRRGGFLGANSAVQHISAGLGSSVGGFILTKDAAGHLEHYPIVGLITVFATLLSLWLAGRLRIVGAPQHHSSVVESLSAAAQGTVDADEPVAVGEM